MSLAWWIYRRLAQAFPHEFKLAYGTEMMQLGEDVMRDIARRGSCGANAANRTSRFACRSNS
jgi:hypothetical protein